MKVKYPLIKTNLPDLSRLSGKFNRIWKNKWYSNFGPFVQEFEKKIAKYYKVSPAKVCTCSNATIGLILAIKALEWDNTILVPSYTFPATVLSIQWNKLPYEYIEISKKYHYAKLGLEEHRNFLPVFPYGLPFIDPRYEDKVCILDAAASFGNKNEDVLQIINTVEATVFSFHATKSFGIGEGGAIIFRDEEKAEVFKNLTNFGFVEDRDLIPGGMNGKMTEMMAAIGVERFKKIKKSIDTLNKVISYFRKYDLINSELLEVENHPWQIVPIVLPTKKVDEIEKILLRKYGIGTGRYYQPMHLKSPELGKTNLPITEEIGSKIISLPIYEDMKKKDVDYIHDSLRKAIDAT